MRKYNESVNYDFSNLVDQYGIEFLSDMQDNDMPYPMDELDEILQGMKPTEIIQMSFFGNRYGYRHDNGFNPNDEYFSFNGYGNLVSIPDLQKYLEDMISESELIEWCKVQGYIEED